MTKRKQLHLITHSRQLREIVTPVRNEIHLTLEQLGEASIGELARHMGRSPESLYYHIRRLEQVGLVVALGERETGGRPEMVYGMAARRVRVDTSVRDRSFLRALSRGTRTLFRYAERCMARALADPTIVLKGRLRECRMIQLTCRLGKKDVIELNRRLLELENFLVAADSESANQRYVVTIGLSSVVASSDIGEQV